MVFNMYFTILICIFWLVYQTCKQDLSPLMGPGDEERRSADHDHPYLVNFSVDVDGVISNLGFRVGLIVIAGR